jgi:hypothetical protein
MRDFQLCVTNREASYKYKTMGFSAEWQHQKGKHNGSAYHNVAQKKQYRLKSSWLQNVHSQQGDIADHTDLAALFELHGRISLRVTDETDDSISVGTILKLTETVIKT